MFRMKLQNSKQRLIEWRKEPSVARLDRPTNPQRARRLGYKAKQGFVVARVRIIKGGRKTPRVTGGRDPGKSGRFFSPGKSKMHIAEQRAARKFTNLEVLNTYFVGEDGQHKWFEVIFADPDHPSVKNDRERNWITSKKHTNRAMRSLTSSGVRMRGLRKK